jgi:hypothetical protein
MSHPLREETSAKELQCFISFDTEELFVSTSDPSGNGV